MSMKFKKTDSGFSLVEMLVAISILLLVIVGPMTVTSRTAKSSSFATEQVQAFFLAQEGLELAQKVRDDLLLNHFSTAASPWSTFTNTSGTYQNCHLGTGCGLEWHNSTAGVLATIQNCSTVANCLLYRKSTPTRSMFTHTSTGNQVTPYTRRVYFTNTGSNAVRVRSVVTWRTGSLVAEQQVEVETYLYNIYATP